ncbi:hypothetical protein BpHYR1_036194 [Brachionus plicatilis]|uniref:Uncharacterized protein n=1 Tax=Brachionus plicatilis TaxID=10195 RepID=A0A3M7RJS9_BRAPC|nr:hypothetical protein BpHYR1_036194 [Brachionus plicatilis]
MLFLTYFLCKNMIKICNRLQKKILREDASLKSNSFGKIHNIKFIKIKTSPFKNLGSFLFREEIGSIVRLWLFAEIFYFSIPIVYCDYLTSDR